MPLGVALDGRWLGAVYHTEIRYEISNRHSPPPPYARKEDAQQYARSRCAPAIGQRQLAVVAA